MAWQDKIQPYNGSSFQIVHEIVKVPTSCQQQIHTITLRCETINMLISWHFSAVNTIKIEHIQ